MVTTENKENQWTASLTVSKKEWTILATTIVITTIVCYCIKHYLK